MLPEFAVLLDALRQIRSCLRSLLLEFRSRASRTNGAGCVDTKRSAGHADATCAHGDAGCDADVAALAAFAQRRAIHRVFHHGIATSFDGRHDDH